MDSGELRDAVGNGIDQAFAPTGEMVTKWAAIVEVMATDGSRWLYTLTPRDAAYWDTIGLLTAAADEARTRAVESTS